MTPKTPPPKKPDGFYKAWAIMDPKGKLGFVDRSKRWALIRLGIHTSLGDRTETFWKEKGYRCIRVTVTPHE